MINQVLKLGALIASGRFLKPRFKGLFGVLLVWLLLWFVHSEFISYVELSGDTRYVLHASLAKLLLYALSISIYVLKVERPLWPKRTPAVMMTAGVKAQADLQPGSKVEPLPAGDDGFDFLRAKKKLKSSSEQLLGKK